MENIEFRAMVKDGLIKVPARYKNKLDEVRVILMPADSKESALLLDELLAHPLKVKGFKPLKRDETHAGGCSLFC